MVDKKQIHTKIVEWDWIVNLLVFNKEFINQINNNYIEFIIYINLKIKFRIYIIYY